MNEENKIGYYAIIPATVLFNEKIKANEKLLYAIITVLSNKEGYCYADNSYLGNLIGVGSRRITKLLKELANNNYITMEYKHKFQRKIYINKDKYTSVTLEEMF